MFIYKKVLLLLLACTCHSYSSLAGAQSDAFSPLEKAALLGCSPALGYVSALVVRNRFNALITGIEEANALKTLVNYITVVAVPSILLNEALNNEEPTTAFASSIMVVSCYTHLFNFVGRNLFNAR